MNIDPKLPILIVSSNDHHVFELTRRLKTLGFNNITREKSGLSALQICAGGLVRLVFCDEEMEMISGWLFAKELKTADSIPNLATVLMGRFEGAQSEKEMSDYGIFGYLRAPFAIKDVMKFVTSSLNQTYNSGYTENRFTKAKDALIFKQYPEAIRLYGSLHQEQKAKCRSSVGLAQAYEKSDRPEAAEAVMAENDNLSTLTPAGLLLLLRLRLKNNDYKTAKECLAALFQVIEGSPVYYLSAMKTCQSADALDLTTYVCRQAIDCGAALPEVRVGLAKVQFLQGDNEGALETLAELTRHSGEIIEALNLEGVIKRRTGRLREAMNCYHRALRLSPMDHKIYFNLGVCAEAMGQQAEAISFLQTSVGIRPDYQKALNKLSTLNAPHEAATNDVDFIDEGWAV